MDKFHLPSVGTRQALADVTQELRAKPDSPIDSFWHYVNVEICAGLTNVLRRCGRNADPTLRNFIRQALKEALDQAVLPWDDALKDDVSSLLTTFAGGTKTGADEYHGKSGMSMKGDLDATTNVDAKFLDMTVMVYLCHIKLQTLTI